MILNNTFSGLKFYRRDIFALLVIIGVAIVFIYFLHFSPIFILYGAISFLGLILLINYPFIALIIDLIFVYIFVGASSDIYSGWSYKVFSFLTIFSLLLYKIFNREKFVYGSSGDILLLLGYVIFIIISSIINSVNIIYDVLMVMLMKYMITFLMINIIDSKRLLITYFMGFVAIGTLNNIVGILQVILHLDWYGFGPRAIGFLVNPNGVGYLEVNMIPIIFILLAYSTKRIEKIVLISLFILCPITAILSESRGTMLATFIVMAGIFLVSIRNYYAFATIIIATIVVALFWQEPYTERLRNTFERKELLEETRGYLYRAAIIMVIEHPFFGVGPGQFGYQFLGTYAGRINAPFRHWYVPHNGYLELLTNAGIPGLLFILALIGLWIQRLLRAARLARLNNDKATNQLCLLMVVSIVGFLVVAAFETLIEVKNFYYLMGLNIVIMSLITKDTEKMKSKELQSQDVVKNPNLQVSENT
jgi:O-antigen ligase